MRLMRQFQWIAVLCSSLLIVLLGSALRINAQGVPTGTLCAALYLDDNGNGLRDTGEVGAADVNLSLTISSGAVVANYVTPTTAPYCVGSLPAQAEYTLRIDSPLYMARDEQPIRFSLRAGERLERDIAIVPRPPVTTAESRPLVIPLDRSSRLLLSALCSVVAMVLIGGLGMVIYGLFFYPRKLLDQSTTQTAAVQRYDASGS